MKEYRSEYCSIGYFDDIRSLYTNDNLSGRYTVVNMGGGERRTGRHARLA